MSKHKKQPAKPVYTPPSQLVWSEERLAALDEKQLVTLLENLQTQRESGRINSETAADVEERIKARLPTLLYCRNKSNWQGGFYERRDERKFKRAQ